MCGIFLFLITLCSAFILLGVMDGIIVYADEIEYTGVLEDLQKDNSFNQAEYDNTSLHSQTELIQIAESKNHELFIYLHVVGTDKGFEKISFSVATSFSELDFRSYNMDLVSSKDGFYKYIVKEFKTPTDSLYRIAISRIEFPVARAAEGTQQVTYEYFPIEQIWMVQKINGEINYSFEYLQTIVVTDKYVGSHNAGVDGGFTWGYQYRSWTDTFYIAFSTDLLMENLLEAQIEYTINYVDPLGKVVSKGDSSKPSNVVIKSDDVSNFENDTFSIFWGVSWNTGTEKRTFKSILKPADFKKNTGITIPKRADKTEFDWVVTFYNKTYTYDWPGVKIGCWPVPVDTTILRLKFETNGVCYNLGVLDNRTSYIPPALSFSSDSLWDWLTKNWKWLVIGIVALFALILFAPLLPVVFSALSSLFVMLLKGLLWIITAPFKLIALLFGGSGKS